MYAGFDHHLLDRKRTTMSTTDDIPGNSTFNGVDALLEYRMLGTIIAGVAYGSIIVISLDCFRRVWKNITRFRVFTPIYIVVMITVSTVSFVLGVVVTMNSILRRNIPLLDVVGYYGLEVVLFPLAMWGADGFMMYRCIMLYQGVPHAWRVVLYTKARHLGSGIMLPVVYFTPAVALLMGLPDNQMLLTLSLVSLTSFVNLTLAVLVTVRLYHHQRNTRKILGAEYGSPYSRTITICVESCALIVVVDLAYIILLILNPNTSAVFGQLLVHASVLSPLLILSFVVRRTDMLSTMKPEPNRRLELEGGRLETLRFNVNHASEDSSILSNTFPQAEASYQIKSPTVDLISQTTR
ncbi:hypothetical protein NLJ89_g7440 [Agrocybe chaxingu]|uniref:Uncharacterized protein n=1 Tax=Agrocybe chaxingu TaxID=84603 RepID=A0A9W8JWE0_9AGAR|nr:hypothetical protein NLJ89_g7440 [Agrocybe chaxingu]